MKNKPQQPWKAEALQAAEEKRWFEVLLLQNRGLFIKLSVWFAILW